MTDILLINPNTTQSITDLVLKTAKRFAAKRLAFLRTRSVIEAVVLGLISRMSVIAA